MAKENPVREKSYAFALRVVKSSRYLQDEKREFILSRQLLKSGTAVGALVEEALQAESKADFIHNFSVANKEAHETNYWLRLLKDSEMLEKNLSDSLLSDCVELQKLLSAIIKTSKQNARK